MSAHRDYIEERCYDSVVDCLDETIDKSIYIDSDFDKETDDKELEEDEEHGCPHCGSGCSYCLL